MVLQHFNSLFNRLSPFEVMYGKSPPTIPSYCLGNSKIEAVDTELVSRNEILNKLQAKLLKAQEIMKHVADKKRIPAPSKQGDNVMFKSSQNVITGLLQLLSVLEK